ncbi:MAG: PAS domain S-box protein, partial [Deltaproteobacteria bacterium]|nr:PAS domain S-box protein [Deltaproteobacteria bacterium]
MESVSTRLRKRKREIVKNCLREYRDQGLAAPLQAEPALNLGIKGLADFIENGQSEGTDVFIEHVAEKVVKKELRPSEGFHIISALRQSTTPVILQETDQSNLLTAMRKVDTYFSRLTEKILSGLEGNSLRGGSEAEKVQRGLEEVERKIIKYTFKKSRGWVDVGGTRMCLLDIPGGWLNIGESIKLFAGGDTSRRVMYEAGLSETFIKRAIEKGVLDYSAQSVGEAIDTFSEAGFGNFVIKELNFSEGYARITCRDSFEGWAHLYNNKCTDKPVCFYSAGVLLSFMQKITRRTDLYSVETHCIAKGDDACEFVIGAQKQLLAKGVRLPEWGQTIKERAEYLENLLEEKNRVEREITLRNKELSALNKISATVNQSLNLEEILNLAVFELSKIVGDKEIGIYLLDRKKEELIFSAHKGYSEEFHKYVSRLKIGEGVVGSVVQQQKPIAYDDYATCPHALIPVMERAKIKSVMCVPLMAKDKIVGVMNIASKISCHFSSEEINLMTLIGNQMGVAIENAQLHEEITESQREYKTLVEDINDGYFICQEGKIIFTNKAFLTMHGYRQEEVLGRRLEDLFFSESIQQVERVYRDRLEDKRISEHIEFRRKHRDGSELPTELKINCVEFKGNPALVGIMRDISERRKMEQKILDSQRLASIGELAAAIAHEIRNPLSAIKMNIQILSKGIKLEGFDKRRLEIAADEINRLDRIVEDVVDFARPIQMKRKERDINDIIGRCIDLLSDKIREKDVQVVRSTCD